MLDPNTVYFITHLYEIPLKGKFIATTSRLVGTEVGNGDWLELCIRYLLGWWNVLLSGYGGGAKFCKFTKNHRNIHLIYGM